MAVLEGRETSGAAPEPAETRVPPQRLASITALSLTLAWLLPIAADTVHLDLIVPLAMWLGVAMLLRAGHTLLDRLVIAAATLGGLLIAEGVLFSFWPWGLGVVPVGGTTLSLLALVGLWIFQRSGRTPQLPLRVRGSDLILLAAPITTWALLRRPISGRSFLASLPYTMTRHDTANHYSLFDAIHRIGGYQYFHEAQAARYIPYMGNYDPGTHYLYVLLDDFRRSTTDPGASIPEFLRYAQYQALGFCLLVLAIPWAARWIAGPSVTGWRRVLICSAAASFAAFGQLSTLFWQSFDAEVLGLTLVALTIAVVARPPSGGVGEHMLIVGALLVALSFVYGLFLVDAGAAISVALVIRRRTYFRAGATRDMLIRTGAGVVALSMIPIRFTLRSLQGLFTEPGAFIDFSRSLSIALGLIGMAAILTRAGRRSPTWWTTSLTVGASCAFALASEIYGKVTTGTPMYYSSKLVESALVISLCGIGSLGLFLQHEPMAGFSTRPLRVWLSNRALRTEAVLSLAALTVPLIIVNGFPMSSHFEDGGSGSLGTSMTVHWSRGRITPSWMQEFAAYSRVGPFGDGVQTLYLLSTSRRNYLMTMTAAALNHDLGGADLDSIDTSDMTTMNEPIAPDNPAASFALLGRLAPYAPERTLSTAESAALAKAENWIRSRPDGLRIAVANRRFADLLRQFAAAEPQHRLTVVYVPGLPTP